MNRLNLRIQRQNADTIAKMVENVINEVRADNRNTEAEKIALIDHWRLIQQEAQTMSEFLKNLHNNLPKTSVL